MKKILAGLNNHPNWSHLTAGFFLSALSLISLDFAWYYAPMIILIITDLYIISLLVEGASRSAKIERRKVDVRIGTEYYSLSPSTKKADSGGGANNTKDYCFLQFPDRHAGLLQIVFLFFIVITSYASMYLASGGVVHNTKDVVCLELPYDYCTSNPGDSCCDQTVVDTKTKAVYFSIVTLSTLGYGDFAPASETARMIVIWEIVTSILLIIGVLQFLVSRITNF
ncbi:MAG: ion channel [Thermodesulfobacteriota bacterium]